MPRKSLSQDTFSSRKSGVRGVAASSSASCDEDGGGAATAGSPLPGQQGSPAEPTLDGSPGGAEAHVDTKGTSSSRLSTESDVSASSTASRAAESASVQQGVQQTRKRSAAAAIARHEARFEDGKAVFHDGHTEVVVLQPHQSRLPLFQRFAVEGKAGGALCSSRPHRGDSTRPHTERPVIDMVAYATTLEARLAAEESAPTDATLLPPENNASTALASGRHTGEAQEPAAAMRALRGMGQHQQSEWVYSGVSRRRRTPGVVGGRLADGHSRWLRRRFEAPWGWRLQQGNICGAPISALIALLWVALLLASIFSQANGGRLARLSVNPLVGAGLDGIASVGGLHASYIHKRGEWWRYFVAPLVSAGVVDCCLNLVALGSIGWRLELRIGSAKYIMLLIMSCGLGGLMSQLLTPLSMSVTSNSIVATLLAAGAVEFAAHWELLKFHTCCRFGWALALAAATVTCLVPMPFTDGWAALTALVVSAALSLMDHTLSKAYLVSPDGRVVAARLHAEERDGLPIPGMSSTSTPSKARGRKHKKSAKRRGKRAKLIAEEDLADARKQARTRKTVARAGDQLLGRQKRGHGFADTVQALLAKRRPSSAKGAADAAVAPEAPQQEHAPVLTSAPPSPEAGHCTPPPPPEQQLQRASSDAPTETESSVVGASRPDSAASAPVSGHVSHESSSSSPEEGSQLGEAQTAQGDLGSEADAEEKQQKLTGAALTRYLIDSRKAAAKQALETATILEFDVDTGCSTSATSSSDSHGDQDPDRMLDVLPADTSARWFGHRIPDTASRRGRQRSVALRGSAMEATDPAARVFDEGLSVLDRSAAVRARGTDSSHSSSSDSSDMDRRTRRHRRRRRHPTRRESSDVESGMLCGCIDSQSDTGKSLAVWNRWLQAQPYTKGLRTLPRSSQAAILVCSALLPIVFVALIIVVSVVETQHVCPLCRHLICTPFKLGRFLDSPWSCDAFFADEEYAFPST